MKNFLFAFLVFIVYSVFGMWYHTCIIKGLCDNQITEETNTTTEIPIKTETPAPILDNLSADGFVIRDDKSNAIFSFADNIKINNKEGSVLIPQSSLAFKDSIFKYLNKNQNKELLITGLRASSESSGMALQRATEVRAILEDFGINADKISIREVAKEFSFDANGAFTGGINFTIKDLSDARLLEIESGIINKTLYSGFASKEFRADNTLQAYALELKSYLQKYPNKKATITGHTDSVGDDLANDWFGMERAKNVKKYLISQGIIETQLEALSKGETEPIETNSTLEGRRKNRRIEIKVN